MSPHAGLLWKLIYMSEISAWFVAVTSILSSSLSFAAIDLFSIMTVFSVVSGAFATFLASSMCGALEGMSRQSSFNAFVFLIKVRLTQQYYPKFDLTGIWTRDLQIISTFHVP